MAFSVHTFETNPEGGNLGFAFHETLGEGQELYFLAKFSDKTPDPKGTSESVFGAIVESFLASKGNAYDRFEDALKAANLEAHKRKQNVKEPPEIVVAFFDFNDLYLSQSGGSEAYLVRGTNLSQITEAPDTEGTLFANILSGQVAIDDIVLLCTSRLLRIVTANQIVDTLSRSDFGEAVSLLRHELSGKSESDVLVTAIGIGKKDTSQSAGFLSKMVSKKKKNSLPDTDPMPEEKVEELPEEDTLDTDEFEEEAFTPEREPLRVKDILSRVRGIRNFKPQKNLLIIAGTVLIVFLVGVGVKFIANYESTDTKELREQLSIAREALVNADTFLLQGERNTAAEFLSKAQESVQKVLNSQSKNFRSDAQFLLADIQEKQLQVENAKKVSPQLLADLGVKNDNLEAMGLLGLKGSLFVHDLKQVYKTVRNIVEKGLPLSDKETILAGAVREDQNTLLFLTDTPRIIEYHEGLITPMSTEDDTWKRGLDIKTYGRFVYILDPVENQIWKYERRRANYSPAVAYNQGADLSRAVSLTIDGSIYVLSDDGTLQKIFRGVKADYGFRDLPSIPFSGKNIKVYTSPNLDFLYVLDPDNSRILVFVKGERFATYKKQVLFDTPGARDFIVDESGQKVNILTKDKIYEFSL
ncbi:protein phosphatase 2C family protein [Candidatus Gracilibacteria bacterium]|nr:protein phosphatase 2C family protein [Candidatus Gracilibacteria bacterium]